MRRPPFAMLLALTCLPAGCNLFGGRNMQAMLAPSDETASPLAETSDPWIAAAAQEARPHLPHDQEPEPSGLKKWFVSSEAREIERHLGVE